jgi:hypothetical protein
MTTMETDMIRDACPEAQRQVERRLHEIMQAARGRDLDRLESFHLFGPKFTKFDDWEPLERQDGETTRLNERESLSALDEFTPTVEGLKIDVFGPVAITTFVLVYDAAANGDRFSARARTTMIFVRDGAEWRIVHEHLSPFKANP